MEKTTDPARLGVARLYARSMLEVARESGAEESLYEELRDLVSVIESGDEITRFFSSPLVDTAVRRDSLEATLRGRASDLLVDALQVVNRKGRLDLLPEIAEAYRRELRELRGEIEVDVTSAIELGEPTRERLLELVSEITGKTGVLQETVEPDVLGGLVLRIGGEKIDMSLEQQLDALSRKLAERVSLELISKKEYTVEAE
ncbi:MAG: ATP synthase F1 subunit delta [Thermoanaerobaculia bacterium]|nr:ATP synthase F1 subunit delta [Thermoanaerobaculia bacterium]